MKPEETLQLTMAEINKKLDHITLLVEGKARSAHESFDDYLSSTEAAEYLKVPIGTLYNLVHRRAIPYMKRGKRLYFDRQELKSWSYYKQHNKTCPGRSCGQVQQCPVPH